MSNNNHIDYGGKYTEPLCWVIKTLENDTFGFKDIILHAKIHTTKVTKCSTEKFNELHIFGLFDFIFEGFPIIDCFGKFFGRKICPN